MKFRVYILLGFLAGVCACTNGELEGEERVKAATEKNELRIVIRSRPTGVNPLLSSDNVSPYVFERVFQTLNALDPKTNELRPALASVPKVETTDDGKTVYSYDLDPAATWPNGTPVTAADVIFSLKILLNPKVSAQAFRPYYSTVEDVVVEGDNRSFKIITSEPYFLAALAFGDLFVYPEYAYDPDSLLRNFELHELADADVADRLAETREELSVFADRFERKDLKSMADDVVGSGPYRVSSWGDGRKIELVKRDDYWAKDRSEEWLTAIPQHLTFTVLMDNTTIANALRNRAADMVTDMSVDQYLQLQEEDYVQQFYDFRTVPGFKVYSILLNQENPIFEDFLTRRAFAHTVNTPQIISRVFGGLADRVTVPVHPSKPYYAKNLPPIDFNLETASDLLAQAGWADSDDDGVLDRIVDGEKIDLSFDLLSLASPVSESVCNYIATDAKKAGFDVQVSIRETVSLYQAQKLGLYAASYTGMVFEPSPDDFTPFWYSTSLPPGGRNRGNFKDAEADSLIRQISMTTSADEREPMYRRFQEIIYDNQPMVFLYSPYDRLVTDKRLNFSDSSLSPDIRFNAIEIQGQ